MTMMLPVRSGKILLLASSALLFAAALAPSEARADLSIGVEAGPLFQIDPPPDAKIGFGFAGRLGYEVGLPIISLTPEVKVAYDKFDGGNAVRALLGARLQLGALLSPNAFAHIGYGRATGDFKGIAADVGLGLDFTPLPLIDIGVFASYNRIIDDPIKLHWIQIGAQATLVF